MFERYTERARRVIFFARYEAAQLGSAAIETEHPGMRLATTREAIVGLLNEKAAAGHLEEATRETISPAPAERAEPAPMEWTELDRRFLRSLKITLDEP